MKDLEFILQNPNVKLLFSGNDGAALQFWTGGKKPLNIIMSFGSGWDHVSVSTNNTRCPTWIEMDDVKRLCFTPGEVVMQIHPAESDHISIKHNCLHLWRPQNEQIPMPPKWMV
jgi:hypothetical protein